MTTAPVLLLAIHLEIASDRKAPPNPNTEANKSSELRFRSTPCESRKPSNPSSLNEMLKTKIIAIFVARNSAIRFTCYSATNYKKEEAEAPSIVTLN